MCGIVGYVGEQPALDVVVGGLKRLEYRGYDSAGIAIRDDAGDLTVVRRAGKLANLQAALAEADPAELRGTLGIGHTRWATHGAPNDRNAHPQVDCTGAVAVVHNGTLENFTELRDGLEQRGHTLAERDRHRGGRTSDRGAVRRRSRRGGPWRVRRARRVLRSGGRAPRPAGPRRRRAAQPAARCRLGEGENFLASDVTAFIAHTRTARVLDQDQFAELRRDGVRVTDIDGNLVDGEVFHVDWDPAAAEKAGYDYFMLKEIDEQPEAVRETLGGRLDAHGRLMLDELAMSDEDVQGLTQVIVVGCGSAYHSGLVAKYAIERWARLPVQVEIASEFRYRDPVLDRHTLVIAISQSGETADTLEAVRHARRQRASVLAVTNTVGSSIARESDATFYTRGGPEVAVASTKAVMTQLVAVYLVGLYLAQVRGYRDGDEIRSHFRDLSQTPDLVSAVLTRMDPVRKLAREIASSERVLFLGRHVGYPMALEGALKLKELAYVSAEGFPPGEIKHGPIALVEKGTPVVVIAPRHALTPKLVTNVQEIRARGARTIVIATDGDDSMVPYADDLIRIPDTKSLLSPLLTAGADASLGSGVRDGAWPRRRPATQPRQERHRRVDNPRTWLTDGDRRDRGRRR